MKMYKKSFWCLIWIPLDGTKEFEKYLFAASVKSVIALHRWIYSLLEYSYPKH